MIPAVEFRTILEREISHRSIRHSSDSGGTSLAVTWGIRPVKSSKQIGFPHFVRDKLKKSQPLRIKKATASQDEDRTGSGRLKSTRKCYFRYNWADDLSSAADSSDVSMLVATFLPAA